jgi:hypothetical protein
MASMRTEPKHKLVIITKPRDQVKDLYLKINKYGNCAVYLILNMPDTARNLNFFKYGGNSAKFK